MSTMPLVGKQTRVSSVQGRAMLGQSALVEGITRWPVDAMVLG